MPVRRRRRLAEERLRAAQDADQIRETVDEVMIDQLWSAVYNRLLVPDEPVDDAFLSALVGNVMDGVAPR